ncbi:uncharacterized protein BCR38DRAFT_468119 [Pseudomassariella vexata]|uniref:Uncharacterized protein n=1 Tax=Pseudomassariella vexata TaxID=1141098 RepID=A0A1Y2DLQ9_9PEZI|nr:uncharacterized protein BCR38DRAFT_468119 [Pseudomassariella vexata]ORY60248.1 hypothetical protein BCR38DRAFT_468119 [Pseudomassariella vexata]
MPDQPLPLKSNTDRTRPGDQYEGPAFEEHASSTNLKDRIRLLLLALSPDETTEEAQVNLTKLLLELSGYPMEARFSTFDLVSTAQADLVIISGRQVEISKRLTLAEVAAAKDTTASSDAILYTEDAEEVFIHGPKPDFNFVWISEALSHFSHKSLFLTLAFVLLKHGEGSKLVIADWFEATYLAWSPVSSPSLWAFAISHGRGGLAFLQAFQALQEGVQT